MVSDEFKRLGVPIVDTDIIAHQIVEPGQPALQEIENAFGADVIDKNGRLRRKKLRELIFSNSAARGRLESILHPLIRQEVGKAVAKVKSSFCIVVIPLLAERGAYPNIDRVLVVDVDPDIQITRLMARDGTSRKQADHALASQASRIQRLAIADDIIDNSGSTEELHQKVMQLHQNYIQLATSASHGIA